MHMNFLNIQENKAKNLFMLFDELMLVFQIDFHHHNFLMTYKLLLLKIA